LFEHPHTATTNGVTLGQAYLFVRPMTERGVFWKYFCNSFVAANGAETTLFTF